MCMLAGASPQSLEDRLAVAKLMHKHPHIFMQKRPFLEGEGLVLYGLVPSWEEALSEPEEAERPDQHWILSVIEQYLGNPPDLYRRSVDPETGDVTLSFHFPAVASAKYASASMQPRRKRGSRSPSRHIPTRASSPRSRGASYRRDLW